MQLVLLQFSLHQAEVDTRFRAGDAAILVFRSVPGRRCLQPDGGFRVMMHCLGTFL
jgi:hypothetical protein